MSHKFPVELGEDNLLLMAEMLVLGHLGVADEFIEDSDTRLHPIVFFLTLYQMDSSFEAVAKELLRQPLRQVTFRQRFFEHFSKHPSKSISSFGLKWLEEVLKFESD